MSPMRYFTDELLAEEAYLVINPVNNKYQGYDSFGDGEIIYNVDFNVTHPRVDLSSDTDYQRYSVTCTRMEYLKMRIGDKYYLVLRPQKDSSYLEIVAMQRCDSTVLPEVLRPVLERDAHRTGVYRNSEEEREDFLSQLNEMSTKNETPEERIKRQEREKDDGIFSEITNKVLKIAGIYFLMPLIVLGSACCVFWDVLIGFLAIFGACFLFLLIAIGMIILKKPLIAWKKKRILK